MSRLLIDNATEFGFPIDWHNPESYHQKIATIIKYETSAQIHFPGTEEYDRRRVREGICTKIFPIILPMNDLKVRLVQYTGLEVWGVNTEL